MKLKRGHVTDEQAKTVGNKLHLDWKKYSVKSFRIGLESELEHGSMNKETNITNDDAVMTGKIALAHLKEDTNYYEKLGRCKL